MQLAYFLNLNSSKPSQISLSMMSHCVRLEALEIEFKILIVGIKYCGNSCMSWNGDELKQPRVNPEKKENLVSCLLLVLHKFSSFRVNYNVSRSVSAKIRRVTKILRGGSLSPPKLFNWNFEGNSIIGSISLTTDIVQRKGIGKNTLHERCKDWSFLSSQSPKLLLKEVSKLASPTIHHLCFIYLNS